MERKTMGAFIAVLRKSSGMTQRELAEKLGVSDKTISHWERDESAPDISIIPIIADIFSVSCDELLRGEKMPAVEKENKTELSQKSEKQINYLLKKQSNAYLIQCIICSSISAAGFALGSLLYDFRAISVLFVTTFFNIISIVSVIIFSIINQSKLTSMGIDEKYLKSCKLRTKGRLIISLLFILMTFLVSVLLEIGAMSLLTVFVIFAFAFVSIFIVIIIAVLIKNKK